MIPAKALAAVTPDELSNSATLYGALKQLRLRLTNADEAALDRAFEMHVQTVLEKLESRLPSLEASTLRTVEVSMARHGLFDASFQQAIVLCQSISPALGESLKELRSAHSRIVADLQQAVTECSRELTAAEVSANLSSQARDQAQGENERLKQLIEALDQECDDHKNEIIELRNELRLAQHQAVNLQDALVSTGTGTGTGTRTRGRSAGPAQPAPFNTSVNRDRDRDRERDPPPGARTITIASSTSSTAKRGATTPLNGGGGGGGGGGGSMFSPTSAAHSTSITAQPAPKQPHVDSWLNSFRTDLQRAIDEKRCRDMSLKACRDFVEKLYESKAMSTERAPYQQGPLNTAVPVETMEMHMYRLLEKKYGLRALAAEHAGMVMLAVNKFAEEDNFIQVFQKTFRNEVEEDFWLVLKELVRSVRDLMMVQLMAKNPTKDQAVLTSMLEQKQGAEGVLTEDEWIDMVGYLYNTSDSLALGAILRRAARDEMVSLGLLAPEDDTSSQNSAFNSPGGGGGGGGSGAGSQRPRSAPQPTGFTGFTTSPNLNSKLLLNTKTEMSKKLGYNSSSLRQQQQQQQLLLQQRMMKQATAAAAAVKQQRTVLRLSFPVFIKCVLDFQLASHIQYLSAFRTSFQQFDTDMDGVLTEGEFRECYLSLQQTSTTSSPGAASQSGSTFPATPTYDYDRHDNGADDDTFYALLKLVDPYQSGRITFSTAASCLSKVANSTVAN